jgi:hypothetical protein
MNVSGVVAEIGDTHILLKSGELTYQFPIRLFPTAKVNQHLTFLSTEVKLIETPEEAVDPWIADFLVCP